MFHRTIKDVRNRGATSGADFGEMRGGERVGRRCGSSLGGKECE
jgi:hypothetical protein